ncbi:uncharacterized protein LOC143182537 [Calliopsis andreniformis]|uniref:uncharacterized protein LOC143182537 n=1 Tax=Calliopsis andreniformis TaxID=337506 RepID=UPI003FCD77AF
MQTARYYYNWHHMLLPFSRFWVFDNSGQMKAQKLIYFLILLSGLIVQLFPFTTKRMDVESLLKGTPCVIITIIFILRFVSGYLSMDKAKEFFEKLQSDWNRITDEEEYKIMKKCTLQGRRYGIFLAMFFGQAAIFVTLLELYPIILNITASTNVSRKVTYTNIPLNVEYFFDQEKYYIFILLHINLVCLLGLLIIIITDTQMLVFAQHSCALLDITGYQIEHAMDACVLPNDFDHDIIRARLMRAIETHKRALEIIQYLEDHFVPSYTFLVILTVPCLSISLYRLSQVILEMNNIEDAGFTLSILLGQFGYLSISNYTGQDVINHSHQIFRKTAQLNVEFTILYECHWYAAPVSARKLLLLVMQRTMKPCYFTLFNGMYVSSLKGLSVRSGCSHIMVILHVHMFHSLISTSQPIHPEIPQSYYLTNQLITLYVQSP